VRELENVLERALAFANDGLIEVGDLSLKAARVAEPVTAAPEVPAEPTSEAQPLAAAPADDALPNNLPEFLSQIERDIILRALNQTQFNRTKAADLLGISVRQLRYQMQKLGIQAPEP
jgi:two-component system response regulator PilR (NtrC family)